jgi:hypothetical protein
MLASGSALEEKTIAAVPMLILVAKISSWQQTANSGSEQQTADSVQLVRAA